MTHVPFVAFIHIRAYEAYQNLKEKHFQVDFTTILSYRCDKTNTIHWYSSCAPSRLAYTEEAELLVAELSH